MAAYMDPSGSVGQQNPNSGNVQNVGFVWPTWDSVNTGNNTWLRQTLIKTYQCPSDPSLGNCLDWCRGDTSYAGNFQVFGGALNASSSSNWDGGARIPGTFTDGTSNTILFAEKYSRCDGSGLGGSWWMRGVYHGSQTSPGGSDDSYPGDRLSAVFAGGVGIDGTTWTQGTGSVFLSQPNPWQSVCVKELSSSAHTAGMNVALGDGSVRFLPKGISGTTWWAACTPTNGEVLGPDW